MGVYIKGIDRKEIDYVLPAIGKDGKQSIVLVLKEPKPFPISIGLAAVPMPHGRLIDADKLCQAMYHEAFETDSDMQKWDSGCWIRYKMFENHEAEAPTVIDAED